MPKKGKKGKKAKSASKKTKEEAEDLDVGEGAQLGISKKKKAKKVKLTKDEKAAAKLVKKWEEFLQDEVKYEKFMQKIDYWMIANNDRVEALFKNFDQESDGVVPYEVFRAGLHDLGCPVTDLEFYALCKKLDPESSQLIEYCEFKRGIHDRIILDEDEVKDVEGKLMPDDDYSSDLFTVKEKMMKENLLDSYYQCYPRYIRLSMRLGTFDSVVNHPNHFEVTVFSHTSVITLVKLIGEVAKVTSGELHVCKEKSCKVEHRLDMYSTLEDNGLIGGPFRAPKPGLLYYDYTVEFSECPLLNCDHYFGLEKRPFNPVLTAYPNKLSIK